MTQARPDMTLVRNFVGVIAYGYAARKIVVDASLQAARTRDDLSDIINSRGAPGSVTSFPASARC